MGTNHTIKTDFLVIGSGIAGLTFAIHAAEQGTVAIIAKKEAAYSSTFFAQGGIAAVLSDVDSFEKHIKDTLECGDGLSKPDVVEAIVKAGPARIQELVDLGVQFTLREQSDELDLGKEGGHSERRVAHAKDFTGQEIERAFLEAIKQHPNITLYENHIAVNLVVVGGKCVGAYVLDKINRQIKNFVARITMIATGGVGKVYLYTSNPDIASGDGIAMAYRAGATVADMEFTQFHPTCLFHPFAKSFLISEALRGEGAILVNKEGKRIMEGVHPLKELAPRDVVTRAIDFELKRSGAECVYLDITHKDAEFVKHRFPGIYDKCLHFGIDITKEKIPVVPAAHYCCGGIATDVNGVTDLPNLLAAGESSCTGLHGANRLASNSLLEATVCGYNAAQWCHKKNIFNIPFATFPEWDPGSAMDSNEEVVITQNWDEIRHFMWNYVGIVRSNKRLERAKNRILMLLEEINEYYWNFKVTSDLIELRNLAIVADLIIESAMRRKESRGIHYNVDYPNKLPIAEHTLLNQKSYPNQPQK